MGLNDYNKCRLGRESSQGRRRRHDVLNKDKAIITDIYINDLRSTNTGEER